MKKQIIILTIATLLSNSVFSQGTWSGSTISTFTNSKVGLSNPSPQAQLDIRSSNAYGATEPSGLRISNTNGTSSSSNIMEILNGPLTFPSTTPSLLFAIKGDGQVYISNSVTVAKSIAIANSASIGNSLRIGTLVASGPYSNYKLSVDGDMIAKRCVIQIDSWADYVFNKDYSLPQLSAVEQYINKNNRLPGVPSENEVKVNGLDVGEMNKILMQKVEELTLYMIQLKKENEEIKERLSTLK